MRPRSRLLPLILLLSALLTLPALAGAGDEENYGFLRIVEGAVTVLSADGSAESAEANLPLLTGDRLSLDGDARLEAVLADRSRLRLDGASELLLTAVAFSADGEARQTRLDLRYGTLQIVVTEEALGDELPRIDVDNATFYLLRPGEYRVRSDGGGASEVVVRRGAAEAVTERGSTRVEAGEAATIEGTRWASTRIGPAPQEDALERWARAAESAGARQVRYVDSSIAYAAADLDSHGTWVSIDSSWAWRPRVATDWRPYWHGRWVYTPSGLTWVSYDPWGWVPHHYGTWSLSPAYGWVWYPGYTYSPAWVYWYWGDRWAGWCPVGYYTRHYRGPSWSLGFRWGHYGWAGGGLGIWSHWNFSPSHRICDRRDRRRPHWRGHELERELGGPNLPRGLVTTDTRGLDPDRLREGRLARDLFGERLPGFRQAVSELPDVTDFVARRGELPPEVRARTRIRPAEQPALRGTPFDPNAAARRAERPQPGWLAPGEGRARLAERPVSVGGGRLDPLPGDGPEILPDLPGTAAERPGRILPGVGRGGEGTTPSEGQPGAVVRTRPERPVRETPATAPERPSLRERPAPASPVDRPVVDRPEPRAGRRLPAPGGEGEPEGAATVRTPAGGDRQNWRHRETVPHAPRAERIDWGSAPPAAPGTRSTVRPPSGSPVPGATPRGTWQSSDRPAPRGSWQPSARPSPPTYGGGEPVRAPAPSGPGVSGDRPPVRRILDGVRQTPGRPAHLAPRTGASPAPRVERPASRPPSPQAPQTSSPRGGGARGGEGKPSGPPPKPRDGRD